MVFRRIFQRKRDKQRRISGGKSRGRKSSEAACTTRIRKNSPSVASTDSSSSEAAGSAASCVLEKTRIHVETIVEESSSSPGRVLQQKPESSFGDAGSIVAEGQLQQQKQQSGKETAAHLPCNPSFPSGYLWNSCRSPEVPPSPPSIDCPENSEEQLQAAQQQQRRHSLSCNATSCKSRRAVNNNKNEAMEAVECIFSEYRKSQHEFVPSLIESISTQESSVNDSSANDGKFTGSILDMTEMAPPTQPCRCGLDCMPPINPASWPQTPLLFRPDPRSGTKIIGIRKENHSEYLWQPKDGDSTSWWKQLHKQWGTKHDTSPDVPPCCHRCVILPINNGNEATGETLVADFESDLFRGSIMLRLRHVEGTTKKPSDDTKGFFAGVPFRYESVIRGNFKTELPFTEMMTGTKLARPCGKLPPKWVMWTALKVVGFFAPQMKAQLDADKPYVLTPLGSGPRVVEVDKTAPTDFLGDERLEPTTSSRSLTGKAYDIKDNLERARARKKHFDKLYIAKDKSSRLWTDPSKTYTFQFLQHLFDYQKFSIDLGSMHMDCKDMLGGQPMQLMAAHGGKLLWAFEIWNECLIEDAKRHAFAERNIGWSVTYTSRGGQSFRTNPPGEEEL